MRSLIIALALALTAAVAFAQMPNLKGPAIPKVEVKVPDVPKIPTEDTFLDATIVEENGQYFVEFDAIIVRNYQPNELRVWAYEAPSKDGPWKSIVSVPQPFNNTSVGTNSMKLPLTKAPEQAFMKLLLITVQGSQGQPAHAEKIYELYCTGMQIKN